MKYSCWIAACVAVPALLSAQTPTGLIQETPEIPAIEEPLETPAPEIRVYQELHAASAAEELYVEAASHLRLPLSQIASSVEIITREDLRAKKAVTLAEALQGALGLDLVHNGGPGQLATLILRGAGSERTRVLLNGVPVTDNIAPARLTDISKLSLSQVERIEIIKGPQSVVHGSGALGGIINVVTAKAGDAWQGEATAEGGSFETYLGRFSVSGREAGVGVALGAAVENTQGYSAAARGPEFTAPQPVPDMDRDGFRGLTLDLALDGRPTPDLSLNLVGRYFRTESELDAYAGDYGDDPNYLNSHRQWNQLLRADWDTLPGVWEQSLSLGWNQIERAYDNPVDPDHPFDRFAGEYRSREINGDWQHHLRAGDWSDLAVGAGYQEEQGSYEERSAYLDWWTSLPAESSSSFGPVSAHLLSVYAEEHLRWQALTVTLGARYDQHDQFGGFTTYRVTPVYDLAAWHTRIKGSWGTGFNAPSLFQLYANDAYTQGNAGLRPETSAGWDLGLEHSWFEGLLRGEVTYFQTGFQDQISAPFDTATYRYVYQNLERVETSGWEASLRVAPPHLFDLRLHYTKLTANEVEEGVTQPLRLRSDYQFGGELRVSWETLSLHMQANHYGPRWDTGNVRLDPYTLVDATLAYAYQQQGEVYLKLRNLFNEKYQVATGYTAAPFAAYAGVTVRWL